jgi:uncharacterized protein YPO0396
MHNLNNSTDPAGIPKPLPGFRLKRLEILNWGTFNGKINLLLPEGRWTLLVGENGSGKSTAVDALRTLLVPPRLLQGSYNDAARDMTAKRRADRSRRSYIRGAWITASREESASGETQYLRGAGVQSLLLAVFSDKFRERDVTLAQILWESNEKAEEVYAIAEGDKNIKEHLAGIEELRAIRRHLRNRGFSTPGSYSAYCEQFRHLLGIPNESALEVFNQAIGVKEVEDLNKFIRQHLLESNDAVNFIRDTLRPHYVQLDECHKAIQVAQQQIEILNPIADHYSRIELATKEKDDLQKLFNITPIFFDWKCQQLLRSHIDVENTKIEELNSKKQSLQEAQNASLEQRDNIAAALARDETEIRIKRLELDIREAQASVQHCLEKIHVIEIPLKLLGEQTDIETEEAFTSLRARVTQKRMLLKDQRDVARQHAITLEAEKREATQKYQAQQAELEHLRRSKVLIPSEFVALRGVLCRAANISQEDLPFVGELIQVKEQYQEWTGVVERLLHIFGIALLVPLRCYDTVSRFINGHRLVDPQNPRRGLRIEFYRIDYTPAASRFTVADEQFVFGRLDFHPDHPLTPWVAKTVSTRFTHKCCDSIEQFQRESKAVTREGSVRDGERHVKDDRKEISDPSDYVLGWTNEKKLQAVFRECNALQQKIDSLSTQGTDASLREQRLNNQLNAADTLLAITNFADIDYRAKQSLVYGLTQEKTALESSSQVRITLKQQFTTIEEEIGRRNTELDDVKAAIAILANGIQNAQDRLGKLERALAAQPQEDFALIGTALDALGINVPLAWQDCEDAKRIAQNSIQGHISRRTGIINDNSTKMQKQMTEFLGKFPHERKNLRDDLPYAPEFVLLLEKLKEEELPKHHKRFEEFLGTNLVGNIASLNTRLREEEKAIRKRIQEVNLALREIEFQRGAYIEVVDAPNRGEEIEQFRQQILACLSRSIYPPAEERPRIFEQIRLLMQRFDTEEAWMRRITDVRNWLDFGVRIKSKDTDREIEFFDKSSGKSGGQKARLAFGILAAAITAQYGMIGTPPDSPTFRLVVIDEVFGRTDEEQSRLALELFQRLNLQLLIVSPFDAKARIVEDFVDNFHVVTNPNADNSRIRRATRAEYESLAEESFYGAAAASS